MKKLRNWPNSSPAHASSGAGKHNRQLPPPLPAKSSSGCGSRPIWSMSSLMEVLPDSPSPICSSPVTEFFTPKHQNGLGSINTSVANKTQLVSFLCPGFSFNSSTDNWKQERISPARRSMSTLYESTFTTLDLQDPNPSLGNPRKSQKHHYQELIYEGTSSQEAPSQEEEEFSRLTRPRPYQEFLDEVQTQQHGAKIEDWKKAKQLKTAEQAETEGSRNNQLEATERKIEIKRAKALKKMQLKIVQANKAAEKQRAHERRAALKKMASVARLSESSDHRVYALHQSCRSCAKSPAQTEYYQSERKPIDSLFFVDLDL